MPVQSNANLVNSAASGVIWVCPACRAKNEPYVPQCRACGVRFKIKSADGNAAAGAAGNTSGNTDAGAVGNTSGNVSAGAAAFTSIGDETAAANEAAQPWQPPQQSLQEISQEPPQQSLQEISQEPPQQSLQKISQEQPPQPQNLQQSQREALAVGLPGWTLEPPQVMVRRKR